jgi:beta-lactamase class A
MTLERALRAMCEQINAKVGVAVAELNDGGVGKTLIEINADSPYRSASVIKVPIIYELYRRAERGQIDLSTVRQVSKYNICPGGGVINALHGKLEFTIEDLATLMIIVSDNSATNELIDIVGMSDVNSTMEELGLKHTALRRKMLGEAGGDVPFEKDNITSPRDCICLLKEIYSGSHLISRSTSPRILDVMKQQKLSYKLPRYLPRGTQVASKGGTVRGVSNDVAIFYLETPLAIAVMCNDLKYDGYATDVIAQMGQVIFDAYS